MCTWRLQLRPTSGAIPASQESRYVTSVHHATVVQRFAVADASADLRVSRGRLKYLGNELLCHEQGERQTCRICLCECDSHRGVMVCGHTYCVGCLLYLEPREREPDTQVRCPVCRAYSAAAEIEYMIVASRAVRAGGGSSGKKRKRKDIAVDGAAPAAEEEEQQEHEQEQEQEQEEEAPPLVGDFSSKVQAVVRRLQYVDRRHPGEKVIVFSQWDACLRLVAKCCQQNGIAVVAPKNAAAFGAALHKFKEDASIQACLINTARGGQGLNLVEASHVVLVEPLANPGMERQAVGRVDRLGQTRPTFVHHLVCADTIEVPLWRIGQAATAADADAYASAEKQDDTALALTDSPRRGKRARKQQHATEMDDLPLEVILELFSVRGGGGGGTSKQDDSLQVGGQEGACARLVGGTYRLGTGREEVVE